MNKPVQLVKFKDAADILGTTENSLRVSAATGGIYAELPVVRLGRSVRIKLADIEKFIEKHTATSSVKGV